MQRIVVEFHGGFRDGCVLQSDSSDPEVADEVMLLYVFTEHGQVGKRFRCFSDAGILEIKRLVDIAGEGPRRKGGLNASMNHVYEVTDRRESADELTLVLTYRGVLPQVRSKSDE